MKILTIVGARPQFIKAAPVSKALVAAGIREFLVHTGQHYDPGMSDVFFDELGLRPPDLNLNVGSGSHATQTAAMLIGLEQSIRKQKPDWVLIYGDTNSTLAGALAATKLHVPVAHVEAGLRSFNRLMPEEINRLVADAIADLLFVPTEIARSHLRHEGVPDDRIVRSGDVMFDAALMFREKALAESTILDRLQLKEGGFALATIHRAENTDTPSRLAAIVAGLGLVSGDVPVVFPSHPRTLKALKSLALPVPPKVLLIEPLGFLDMVRLEMASRVVATDSGGVQKEAFFHGVPCVTLRHETEWTELVDHGWNQLCPPANAEEIAEAIITAAAPATDRPDFYGLGDAAIQIAHALGSFRRNQPSPKY